MVTMMTMMMMVMTMMTMMTMVMMMTMMMMLGGWWCRRYDNDDVLDAGVDVDVDAADNEDDHDDGGGDDNGDDDAADVDDVSDPTPGWHPTPPWGTRGSPPHTGVASLSVSRAPGEWEAATRTCLTQSGPSGASHSFSSRSAPNTSHPFRAKPPANASTGRDGIEIRFPAAPHPTPPTRFAQDIPQAQAPDETVLQF